MKRLMGILIGLGLFMPVLLEAATLQGELSWVEAPVTADSHSYCKLRNPFVDPESTAPLKNAPAMAVFLENQDRGLAVKAETVLVEIDNLRFSPAVIGVRVGQNLEVVNRSGYTLTLLVERNDGQKRVVRLPSRGGKSFVEVTEPGLINLHIEEFAHLSATVMAVADLEALPLATDGTFSYSGLEPGTYHLRFWNGKWRNSQPFFARLDQDLVLDIILLGADAVIQRFHVDLAGSVKETVPTALPVALPPQPPVRQPVATPPRPAAAAVESTPAKPKPKAAPAPKPTPPAPVAKKPAPKPKPTPEAAEPADAADKKKKTGIFKIRVIED